MEQIKTIRPRNWLYESLVMIELILIVGIWWMFSDSWRYAFVFGGFTYLAFAWTLRLILQRYHRKGMQLLRLKKYEEAVEAFQNSHNFFAAHPWIDKCRFITMFSSSAIPYRQMALNNLGICYLYMGEDAKALDEFKKLAKLNSSYPYIDETIREIQSHIDEATRN